MDNIRAGMLHRAFSVFLFNTKGEVLLQKVSKLKAAMEICLSKLKSCVFFAFSISLDSRLFSYRSGLLQRSHFQITGQTRAVLTPYIVRLN